jgi:hypothetical protein
MLTQLNLAGKACPTQPADTSRTSSKRHPVSRVSNQSIASSSDYTSTAVIDATPQENLAAWYIPIS